MWITVDVQVEELTKEIVDYLPEDSLVEFIKDLDLAVCDIAFSKHLINYLIRSVAEDFNTPRRYDKVEQAIKLLEEAFEE